MASFELLPLNNLPTFDKCYACACRIAYNVTPAVANNRPRPPTNITTSNGIRITTSQKIHSLPYTPASNDAYIRSAKVNYLYY